MAGTTIGEVNINLRMSIAQFKQDVKDGTDAARNSTRRMASEMGGDMRTAKASMALLGEEIGITIPRHLRTFIGQLPGVASALTSAFNSIAVLALIEVIIKVIEKIQDFGKKAREAGQGFDTLHTEGEKALRAVDVQILEAQKHLADLRKNHIEALRDSLKLIDAQTLDNLVGEFDKVAKKADDLFLKLKVNWIESLFVGGNKQLETLRQQFEAVVHYVNDVQARGGDIKEVWAAIHSLLAQVNTQLENANGISEAEAKALLGARDALQQMETYYRKISTLHDTKSAVVQQEAYNKVLEKTNHELENIVKNMRYIRPTNPAANGMWIPSAGDIDQGGIFGSGGAMKGAGGSGAIYSGTKEAEELYKVQTDQNEAIKEAQKVYTQIQTPFQKYTDQVAILAELYAQGRITADQFEKAERKLHENIFQSNKVWKDLGRSIGQTIEQAALFGRSWSDAFKSILIQLAEVIIQMTVLKKLQQDMEDDEGGGGGGGGFFGSLLGGVFGLFGGFLAGGGPLDTGKWYIAGEHGPEPIWGGGSGAFAAGYSGRGAAVVVNYNIDARGSSITEKQFKQSLQESEKRAVQRAVTLSHDQLQRK